MTREEQAELAAAVGGVVLGSQARDDEPRPTHPRYPTATEVMDREF